jgi:hypothetical protein
MRALLVVVGLAACGGNSADEPSPKPKRKDKAAKIDEEIAPPDSRERGAASVASSEVAAVFNELTLREEQYRMDNGVFTDAPRCPDAPSAEPRAAEPCLELWRKLNVRLPSPRLRCSYEIVAGRGAGAAPRDFTFAPPVGDWYYAIAHCAGERFFVSSVDLTIQRRAN